ncbi:MAG: DUF262 domain-containing protein [Actinomycetota bacterium]
MSAQVEASTVNAGQLFSNSYFYIPDFQRPYSWTVKDEVTDFWRDLSETIETPPYFLGLLIVTTEREDQEEKTVVDGQQRLVTLTLLASALRAAALARGKKLVADSLRDMFLLGLDYETEEWHHKITFSADADRSTYEWLVGTKDVIKPEVPNALMVASHKFLAERIEEDLKANDDSVRLAKWARLLSNGLTFARFDHPDRNAAYKVYEVVNTRGKDLTPADLIKGYALGTASSDVSLSARARWAALEEPFRLLDASAQFTQFIRHVITLRHGYVLPRDLYQIITRRYEGSAGVDRLLLELEESLGLYIRLIDPSVDSDLADDIGTSFVILQSLGLSTVRPAFLAIATLDEHQEALRRLVQIVVTRIVAESFGTGSVERRFADAARDIFLEQDWRGPLENLLDLMPRQRDFEEGLAESQSKGVLLVIRSSVLQTSALPQIHGYLHQVRPKNSERWMDFSDKEFTAIGNTIGNFFISEIERRPRGTNNPQAVQERLLTTRVREEIVSESDFPWTPQTVEAFNSHIASTASQIWYA